MAVAKPQDALTELHEALGPNNIEKNVLTCNAIHHQTGIVKKFDCF